MMPCYSQCEFRWTDPVLTGSIAGSEDRIWDGVDLAMTVKRIAGCRAFSKHSWCDARWRVQRFPEDSPARQGSGSGEDASAHLSVISIEPTVRAELMEQVPHIALFCQENRPAIPYAFSKYLLPIVVRYLADQNNQVGGPCPRSYRNGCSLGHSRRPTGWSHWDVPSSLTLLFCFSKWGCGESGRSQQQTAPGGCYSPAALPGGPQKGWHLETFFPRMPFLFHFICYSTTYQVLSLQNNHRFLLARFCQLWTPSSWVRNPQICEIQVLSFVTLCVYLVYVSVFS